MIYIVIFFLTTLVLFLIFSNASITKKYSAAERNLKMLEEKVAQNTVDEHQLADSFEKRLQMFFYCFRDMQNLYKSSWYSKPML